jgi:tRNA(adenine34) deaminase
MLAGMGGTIWDGAMIAALAAARAAAVRHDVPVGAVVLDPGGDVVATAGNEREQRQDPTAHAEVLALRAAAQSAGTWRLDGHTLVVTLEPCTMCAGAVVLARIPTLVFGAYDPKAGAVASLFDVVRDPRLNHRVDVRGGILEAECAQVLLDFFAGHRAKS